MVNFDNATKDGQVKVAQDTLRVLQQKVRSYAEGRGLTPAQLAKELDTPELQRRDDGSIEEFPGLFDRMIAGLPYANNAITVADVEEALNA